MAKIQRFRTAKGNMRTEMVTAWGVEGAIEAAAKINARTAWLNSDGADARRYARARAKITMPADITAWLVIKYANGSEDRWPFDQYYAVRDAYQNSISYSGGRVKRVEVEMRDGGVRAIWDVSWTDESKYEGLRS